MPFYDLEEVRKIATHSDNIFYSSRKVRRDITNLGYTVQDVANCLCALTPEHFYKQESYENSVYLDAYRIQYSRILHNKKVQDDLYIKFRITSEGRVLISLASFHLSS